MTLGQDTLELGFGESSYGLSARRLWEHTQLGQINVFSQAISARQELNDAATFVDVVWFEGGTFSLAGMSLADLRAGRLPHEGISIHPPIPPGLMDSADAVDFVRSVAEHLSLCSIRQATRNQQHPFLPSPHQDAAFGVPLVFSTLQRRLLGMGKSKAGAEQWRKTIENFQKKGLRAEELDRSRLMSKLLALQDDGDTISAVKLAGLCCFKELTLSMIPVVSDAQRQLHFSAAPERALKRTRKLPKAQAGQTRDVAGFDPILGYRIEQVEHQALWGIDSHWQAVMHDGEVVHDSQGQCLFPTRDDAAALAALHAKQNFPKRVALGRFSGYAWTGGESYREWLMTLPHYPVSYLSGHFKVRNVLAHVRCDLREGADGERVLMLQEVQSDWAQRARRTMDPDDERFPPFVKEWSALALKLMLLHAVHQGLDAVAWTRGAHQAIRYNGLGAAGLAELYDRTLPREVNRMMKPFAGACEMLGVFVPTNFSIRQAESGYQVFTVGNELLGTAATLEEARSFVPDGGHELLYDVHGVRLSAEMRRAILKDGFPAWG